MADSHAHFSVKEYGTTIAEKRSVGVKICHGLLEKIKFDLGVARSDQGVDMRYMINMEYSADLPINTMGRRIRTRLYFTSESHLHTVLNVLRFANGGDGGKPILSRIGTEMVNKTPELCYLTHIVMRVFEDSRPEMQDDSRRFRVEILFSPGALDSSRFDTAPLHMIGREGLTCEELEAYFGKAIMAGRTDDEVSHEAASLSTMYCDVPRSPTTDKKTKKAKDISIPNVLASSGSAHANALDREIVAQSLREKDARVDDPLLEDVDGDNGRNPLTEIPLQTAVNTTSEHGLPRTSKDEDGMADLVKADHEDEQLSYGLEDDEASVETFASEKVSNVVARKYFWTTVAVGSFILGASCLLLAMRLTDESRQRRWSSRRYGR